MLGKYKKSYLFDVRLQLKSIEVASKTPAEVSFELHIGRCL